MGNWYLVEKYLLSDGVSTYTYNLANRLTAFTDGANTTTYAHPSTGSGQANGLGDHLQQTVNSATTTYYVDMAGGLANCFLCH